MDATWIFSKEQALFDYLHSVELTPEADRARRSVLIPKLTLAARELQLPRHIAHHSSILLHRLLLVLFSWTDEVLLAAALLIASKAEEVPRKAAEVIKVLGLDIEPLHLLDLEATVMAKTGFDFTIDTPMRHVVRLVNTVISPDDENAGNNVAEAIELALQLVEQVLRTQAICLFNVRVIAASCVQKAASLVECKIKADADWRCDDEQLKLCTEYILKHKQ